MIMRIHQFQIAVGGSRSRRRELISQNSEYALLHERDMFRDLGCRPGLRSRLEPPLRFRQTSQGADYAIAGLFQVQIGLADLRWGESMFSGRSRL